MKCEYCEFRKIAPFIEQKICTLHTDKSLKICIHTIVPIPDPCMNGGDGCGLYKTQKGERANERRTAEQ